MLRPEPAAAVWSGGPMNLHLIQQGRIMVRSVTATGLARKVPVAENSSGPQVLRCVVRADAAGSVCRSVSVFPIGSIRCPECARAHRVQQVS